MRVLNVLIHPSYNVFKVRVSGCNWQLGNLNTVQTQPTVYMALYLNGATSATNSSGDSSKKPQRCVSALGMKRRGALHLRLGLHMLAVCLAPARYVAGLTAPPYIT